MCYVDAHLNKYISSKSLPKKPGSGPGSLDKALSHNDLDWGVCGFYLIGEDAKAEM